MNASQSRQPAGIPIGGQFASGTRPRAVVDLGDSRPALNIPAVAQARRQQLRSAGYIPPRATDAISDPRFSEGREDWWNYNFRAAEYGDQAGDYPQMPDDNTPGMTDGESLSGHRRTHRMHYSGGGVELRMPSATAIKRFANSSHRKTFDVPVSATYPGGSVQGWVRVTQGGDGQWASRPLDFRDPASAAYVGESVSAVLESRRPSRALREVGDLIAAHRDRERTVGGALIEIPPSTWMSGLGYDRANETLVMTTAGRRYGYQVPPETYTALRSSSSPGSVYNRLVRNKAPRVPIAQCPSCHRFYNETAEAHRCPPRPEPRDGTTPLHNMRALNHAREL